MESDPQFGSMPTMAQPAATQPPTLPPLAPIPSMAPLYAAPPQERRGIGGALSVIVIALVILAMIGFAASTLPGSATRARIIAYPPPSVAITIAQNNGPVQVGANVLFVVAVSAGRDLTFTWDFGDGSTGSGAQVSHAFTDYGEGTYTVTLTAVDPIGQRASAQLPVNVVPEQPTASFTSSADPSAPLDVRFDSTSTGTQLTCSWDFGDGSPGVSGDCQPTHEYQDTGTVTVMLTVTDIANQTASTSEPVTVSIPKPVASFSVATYASTCVDVDASDSTGYQLSYVWDFGEGYGSSSGFAQASYCYSSPGTYTITLTVTDGGNQKDIVQHTVTVG